MPKVCDYTIRETVSKKQVDDTLLLFNNLKKQGINLFARDGFLLGVARHKGFLPFDVDPDIGILADDYPKLRDATLPENYYITVSPFPVRNIEYYLKTGKPYDFTIHKSPQAKNIRTFLCVISLILIAYLLVLYKNTRKIGILILLPLILLITWVMWYFIPLQGEKIGDGTVFPKKSDNIFYQEVEKVEQHVFNSEYGHAENEEHFTWKMDDILPLKYLPFYHGEIPVPKNYMKVLEEHYGQNVFNVMYKKEDKNMVKTDISNCEAPPAKMV